MFQFSMTLVKTMACWMNGDKEEARKYYREADDWLQKNQPGKPGWPRIVVEKLHRFRTEADEVMGISKQDIKGQKTPEKIMPNDPDA